MLFMFYILSLQTHHPSVWIQVSTQQAKFQDDSTSSHTSYTKGPMDALLKKKKRRKKKYTEHPCQKSLILVLLLMITGGLLPLSLMENEDFKEFAEIADPQFQMPLCKHLSYILLPNFFFYCCFCLLSLDIRHSNRGSQTNRKNYIYINTHIHTHTHTHTYVYIYI